MKIIEFNTEKGLYEFEFSAIETDFHSHPTLELIIAIKGCFSVSTTSKVYNNLTFIIIDNNTKHSLYGKDCELKVMMVEHNINLVKKMLGAANILLVEGVYFENKNQNQIQLLNTIKIRLLQQRKKNDYDLRVAKIIDYIDKNELEYDAMLETLKEVAFLSKSRLSHLFKENLGISLKKYLLWNRLKITIKQHINHKDDLFTALIKSGFYDQPHFSKAFKIMLGVKPTQAYNSRTVQDLSDLHP